MSGIKQDNRPDLIGNLAHFFDRMGKQVETATNGNKLWLDMAAHAFSNVCASCTQ